MFGLGFAPTVIVGAALQTGPLLDPPLWQSPLCVLVHLYSKQGFLTREAHSLLMSGSEVLITDFLSVKGNILFLWFGDQCGVFVEAIKL